MSSLAPDLSDDELFLLTDGRSDQVKTEMGILAIYNTRNYLSLALDNHKELQNIKICMKKVNGIQY